MPSDHVPPAGVPATRHGFWGRVVRSLWVQVLLGMVLGVILGSVNPRLGAAMRPLGDGFVRIVRMLIAPLIFTTVVTGIARMGDLKKVGRVGLKALVYFEIVTTLALLAGLAAGRLFRPGAGMHVDPATLDTTSIAAYTAAGQAHSLSEFALSVVPKDVVDAFAKGDILQVLFFSILFGVALAALKADGSLVFGFIERVGGLLLRIVAIVMRAAPLGAFGAMAFTVGAFGLASLLYLGVLVAGFAATCLLFVLVVFGLVLRSAGLGLFRFLRFLREEIVIVLGTSSSESALPFLMRKMERLGCSRSVAGLVIPLGYSFNLAGTSIYLTLAALFIAQATGTPLTTVQTLEIFGVLLLTSKTAAAVTGGGFITLAATLSAVGSIPLAGLTLLLGVDRLLSEGRALTNLIGNGVAAVAVSRWERELDTERARAVLTDVAAVEAEEAESARIERGAAVPDVVPGPTGKAPL